MTINRSDLETVLMGQSTFREQFQRRRATIVGDRQPFADLMGMLTEFSMEWEILPGTIPVKDGGTAPDAPGQRSPAGAGAN